MCVCGLFPCGATAGLPETRGGTFAAEGARRGSAWNIPGGQVEPFECDETPMMVTTMMPEAMDLTVPLLVEAKTGPTWGDMDSVD